MLWPRRSTTDPPTIAAYHAKARRGPGVPRPHNFWVDHEQVTANSIAVLRVEAGRDPCSRALTDLAGELSTRNEADRIRWASRDVHLCLSG
ncbi:hypothetical protein AB0F30_34955 [Streptomyces sp. NPDC029006]|uniref:MmyB family transcriptional regulator n=1 Tax=Streptomyces sp. NPDC029006 TaxID=3155467 RepID=UPI0033ECC669